MVPRQALHLIFILTTYGLFTPIKLEEIKEPDANGKKMQQFRQYGSRSGLWGVGLPYTSDLGNLGLGTATLIPGQANTFPGLPVIPGTFPSLTGTFPGVIPGVGTLSAAVPNFVPLPGSTASLSILGPNPNIGNFPGAASNFGGIAGAYTGLSNVPGTIPSFNGLPGVDSSVPLPGTPLGLGGLARVPGIGQIG